MKEISPWRIRRPSEADQIELEPEYAYAPEPDEFQISDYWKVLVKRRRIILILFFLVLVVGSYFPFSATSLYTSSATVKIEPQIPRVTGVGAVEGLQTDSSRKYDYYKTQFRLLESRPVAARVITDLGLESNRLFTRTRIIDPSPLERIKSSIFRMLEYFSSYVQPLFESAPPKGDSRTAGSIPKLDKQEVGLNVAPYLISRYLSLLEINHVGDTRLVNVKFTTPDPALSQALANAHVQAFLRMSLESRFSLTEEAQEFLDQKKMELREKLAASEGVLNKFRRKHGVVSLEKGENIVVDRMVDLNRKLTAARAQRIAAESLYRTVENKNYQDIAKVMGQGLIPQLKSRVTGLEAERARLSTIFKSDHPRIQNLDQQISEARRALEDEISNIVRGVKSSYAAALAEERALESEADRQQQNALNLKEIGVEYAVLQEEVNANRSLYDNVLRRLSETNVSNDIAMSNMQIAERAERPSRPSIPNIPLFLLVTIFLSTAFAVGMALLLESLDSTVGTPHDVLRFVGLSTLGVVPHLKHLRQRTYGFRQLPVTSFTRSWSKPKRATTGNSLGKDLMIAHHPFSIISESYRNIRTALLLSQAEKPPQVVLLTSPRPREGKTVTTLNLAVALAQSGHSVLVIDADLRKGTCHNLMKQKNHRGLTEVLTGALELEEGVKETRVAGLSLLSRGKVPPNPADLLGALKMKETVDVLRKRFNFILIDSPPVIAVTDAVLLSKMSDGVLLVLRGRNTTTDSARQATDRLEAVHAKILGVILNGVDINDPEYVDYREYYSSYYDSVKTETDDTDEGDHESHKNGGPDSVVAEEGPPHPQVVEEQPRADQSMRDREPEAQVEAPSVSKGPKVQASKMGTREAPRVIRSREEALRAIKGKPQEEAGAQSWDKEPATAEKKSIDETVRAWTDKILQGLDDLGSNSVARFAVGIFLAILLLGGVASATLQNQDRMRSLSLQTEKLLSLIGERFGILKDNIGELLAALSSSENEPEKIEASLVGEPSAGPIKKTFFEDKVRTQDGAVFLKDEAKPSARPDIQEIPSPEARLSTSSSVSSPAPTWKESPVIMKRGSTIRKVATDFYGSKSLLLGMSLIKDFNPQIKDLYRVSAGEKLWVPPPSRETLVRKQKDGSYLLILESFGSIMQAVNFAQVIRNRGYQVVIAPQTLSDNLLLHRVQVEGLKDLEAVDQAWDAAAANQWFPVSDGRPAKESEKDTFQTSLQPRD
jgi:capsular exopolysaccharide synthesis family protein